MVEQQKNYVKTGFAESIIFAWRAPGPRPAARLAQLLILTFFMSLALGMIHPLRAAAADPAPKKVFIAPFQGDKVPADQQWIGPAIGQALSTELSRIPGFFPIRQNAPAGPAAPATEQAVLKAARLAQAPLAVYGTYVVTDGQAQLTARVLDVKTGKELATEEAQGALTDLLKVQERLVGQVRKVLLQPAPEPAPAGRPVPPTPPARPVPPVVPQANTPQPAISRPPATRPHPTTWPQPSQPPQPQQPQQPPQLSQWHERLIMPGKLPVDAAHVTDAEVREAIRKGCDALLNSLARMSAENAMPARLPAMRLPGTLVPATQNGPRMPAMETRTLTDEEWAQRNGGMTMLALYALLHAGRVVDDPRLHFSSPELDPYVQWALRFNPHDTKQHATYTAGLQAGALAQLPPRPEFRGQLKRIRDELLLLQQPNGGYSYTLPVAYSYHLSNRTAGSSSIWDNSNSQYGLLGIWAVADADVEVPMSYWQRTDAFWHGQQSADGRWPYVGIPNARPANSGTPSMTAAGIASLLVTREYLGTNYDLVPHPDAGCERGLAAMDRYLGDFAKLQADRDLFAPQPDPRDLHPFDFMDGYFLFSLERVGLASGRKTFGGVNWYRQGAAAFLNSQTAHGYFTLSGWGGDPVPTAYGVLFLTRGMSPVAVNKLEYKGYWNARDRDAANLVNRLGKRLERPLSWQVVKLSEPEDFLDAPLLLITGSQDVKFTAEELGKLRAFVEAGGTIFSSADGRSAAFTAAMRRAAGKMFQDRYEMRALPSDHPVFNLYARIEKPVEILGASNGVREYWIHSSADLGAAWQGRKFAEKEKFDLPANILFYVSGKEPLRRRLETLLVPAPKVPPVRKTRVLRFEYAGNWDPEPGAWRRMAQLMAHSGRTELEVVTGKAADVALLDPRKTPLVHLTGTTAFELVEDERKALRAYIEGGGTLLVEAAGGAGHFTPAVTKALTAMYPDNPIETIPRDDPLYSGRLEDSADVTTVEYGKFWQQQQGGASPMPRLWGLKRNGRWAVLVSPDNMSNGFLGTQAWGITGYTSASAEKVGRSIILYAQAGGVVPAQTQPATAPAAAATTQAAGGR